MSWLQLCIQHRDVRIKSIFSKSNLTKSKLPTILSSSSETVCTLYEQHAAVVCWLFSAFVNQPGWKIATILNHHNTDWKKYGGVEEVMFKSDTIYLKGVFPADVVVHGQHGDVKAGQQDTSQDVVLFLICTWEIEKSGEGCIHICIQRQRCHVLA